MSAGSVVRGIISTFVSLIIGAVVLLGAILGVIMLTVYSVKLLVILMTAFFFVIVIGTIITFMVVAYKYMDGSDNADRRDD